MKVLANESKVTEEQAGEALQQLLQDAKEENEGESESVEPAAEQASAAPTEQEPEPESASETPVGDAPQEAVAEDDLASLRGRLEALEKEKTDVETRFESRWKALRDRNAQNEQILRDRFLRKSTQLDRALKTLKATRTETGVAESEVDGVIREIESGLNPASANYTPPAPQYDHSNEDRAMIANAFLNEMGMTFDDAESFKSWLGGDAQTALSPQEQRVAERDLDGFLRLAHNRWQSSIQDQAKQKEAKKAEATSAVKTVQRVQREAARAATTTPAAPKTQPTHPESRIDVSKLTSDDISRLLRESVLENQ